MRDTALDLLASTAGHAPYQLLFVMIVVAAAGSLLPFSPIEPLLVLVAGTAPPRLLIPLVVVTTASHMAVKVTLFVASRRAGGALSPRRRESVGRARALLARRPALRGLAILASAAAGVPPFYAITVASGALRLPLREFIVLGTIGRGARFAVLVLAGAGVMR